MGLSDHIKVSQTQFGNPPRSILTSNSTSIDEHNINLESIWIQYRKEGYLCGKERGLNQSSWR